MELNEYQDRARNTAIYPKEQGFIYTALGLAGEAGEVANKAKKVIRDHGGVLTDEYRSIIADELGDVLWYLANSCFEIEIELETIADMNLKKLSVRQSSNTLKGDNRDDSLSGMAQSVLKVGDIVRCYNNYIIKSVDWGKGVLVKQITVSQSLYRGYHPELWKVDIEGVRKKVWILPQDKIEQKEEIKLNDTPEEPAPIEETPQETPTEEVPDQKGDNIAEDTPSEEETPSEQEQGTPASTPEPEPETPEEAPTDPPADGEGEPTAETESGPEAPAEEVGAEPQPSEEEVQEEPVEQPSQSSEPEEE